MNEATKKKLEQSVNQLIEENLTKREDRKEELKHSRKDKTKKIQSPYTKQRYKEDDEFDFESSNNSNSVETKQRRPITRLQKLKEEEKQSLIRHSPRLAEKEELKNKAFEEEETKDEIKAEIKKKSAAMNKRNRGKKPKIK